MIKKKRLLMEREEKERREKKERERREKIGKVVY
jgi:hypothetical protein